MDSIETVESRLKTILLRVMKNQVDPDAIHSAVPLVREGLSLDSVTLLEFVVSIESDFQIMLDEGALTMEHFESLGALARAIQREVETQGKG